MTLQLRRRQSGLSGTAAQLATTPASSVPDKTTFTVTDDPTYGKAVYQALAGAWTLISAVPLGASIIKEIIDNAVHNSSAVGGTVTDMFAFSFVVPASGRCAIEFFSSAAQVPNLAMKGIVYITDSANIVLGTGQFPAPAVINKAGNIAARTPLLTGLVPGSTFNAKIRLMQAGGNGTTDTFQVSGATAGFPIIVRVLQ